MNKVVTSEVGATNQITKAIKLAEKTKMNVFVFAERFFKPIEYAPQDYVQLRIKVSAFYLSKQ